MPSLDVGDTLTVHCRENNLPYTSIPNSHNDPELWNQMAGIWHEVGRDCGVDRCFYDGEVIFTHLGRGIPKSLNAYYKQGLPEIDVGDTLTVYCRDNDLSYTSIPNSHNDPELWNQMQGIWHDVGRDCGVDRCFYDGEVIFAHLGRGIPKSLNAYYKQGKITYLGWQNIHQEYLK